MSDESRIEKSFDSEGDFHPSVPDVRRGRFSLHEHLQDLHRLRGIENLLSWDQEVCMPRAGAIERARQLEWVTRQIQRRMCDPVFFETISDLSSSADLSVDEAANVRELKRVLDIERRIPEDLAGEKARAGAMCYSVWLEARERNDFGAVSPWLEKLIGLCRQEAECFGYEQHPYDALLAAHDVEMTYAQLAPIFQNLTAELKPILQKSISRGRETHPHLARKSSEAEQTALIRRVLSDMGFNFEAGRLDKTAHPFQATVASTDVRITTQFCVFDYQKALFSALHEAGHGLYELGLPSRHSGTPLGASLGLTIHESQSRLWENMVGRSRAFCAYLHRLLAEYLPEEHKATDPFSIWRQVNRVSPGLIRMDADEVSYSLHIIIRTELERALIGGELKVAELPDAWNAAYELYLGVRPETESEGVLQDVHWYGGDIGYFPTYVLGNLYGAAFFESARSAIPDLDLRIEKGDFKPLLRWLNKNIYEHGMRFRPAELLDRVCSGPLSATPFLNYLKDKFLGEESGARESVAA